MFCIQCGKGNPDGVRFCSNCGTKFSVVFSEERQITTHVKTPQQTALLSGNKLLTASLNKQVRAGNLNTARQTLKPSEKKQTVALPVKQVKIFQADVVKQPAYQFTNQIHTESFGEKVPARQVAHSLRYIPSTYHTIPVEHKSSSFSSDEAERDFNNIEKVQTVPLIWDQAHAVHLKPTQQTAPQVWYIPPACQAIPFEQKPSSLSFEDSEEKYIETRKENIVSIKWALLLILAHVVVIFVLINLV